MNLSEEAIENLLRENTHSLSYYTNELERLKESSFPFIPEDAAIKIEASLKHKIGLLREIDRLLKNPPASFAQHPADNLEVN